MKRVWLPFIKRSKIVFGSASHDTRLSDPLYADILAKEHKRVTPEVEGKYYYVRDNGWEGMDALVKWALAHGLGLDYHCVLWRWEDNIPPDPAAWISEAMQKYPVIIDYHVVNEGYAWDGTPVDLGIEISDAYRLARKLRPDAQLWYNGSLRAAGEQAAVLKLVDSKEVDCVGIECHLAHNSDILCYESFLQQLNERDTPWAITELDVLIPEYTAEYLALQALQYARVREMAVRRKARAITTWEFGDRNSWKAMYYPLLYDVAYNKKPCWYSLRGG